VKKSVDKQGFIEMVIDRSGQYLFVSDAEKSCQVKESHDLGFR